MSRKIASIAVAVALACVASPAWAQESEPGSEPVTEPASFGAITYTDVVLLVDGRIVDAAPAGVRVDARITFRNDGEERARDVVVRLEEPAQGWEFIDGRATLGDLAPGDEATATFAFSIDPASCFDSAGFGATVTSSLGEAPLKVGFAMDCPGPRLYAGEIRYRGGDGDGVPEPGERLEVIVQVYNAGHDPATDVRGTLTIDNPDVRVIDGTSSWPRIDPDASERNETPFVIQISDDAKRADGCGGGGPMITDGPPPEDTDDSVSSDGGSVSSDGTVVADDPDQGGGGSSGQSEPGSAGSGDEQTAIEEGTIEPEPPTKVEPEPDGTIEPAPDDGRAEEPTDQAVMFEGPISIQASGTTQDVWLSSGAVCMYMENARGGTGTDDKALGAPVALGGERDSAGGTPVLPTTLAAIVLAGAAGLGAWRFVTRKRVTRQPEASA